MDQIVNRPSVDSPTSIASALDLNEKPGPGRGRLLFRAIVLPLFSPHLAAPCIGGPHPHKRRSSSPPRLSSAATSPSRYRQPERCSRSIQVDISSELSGVVRSVNVDENDTVKKGDVLAELDTVRIAANVDRAEASVKVAQAQVGQAQTTLKEAGQTLSRAQQLSDRGMVAQQALDTALAARDRAVSAVAVAEANLAIARAELKLQQADLQKSRIYAPVDGIVLTRSVDPGQTVASSLQAPVLFVLAADLRKMELKAAIDEADIGAVRPGQPSRFTVDAFPERRFDAEIRDISFASATTEGVVTYDARLDVDNGELLLRPGMTATVAVVTREASGVLTIPERGLPLQPSRPAGRNGMEPAAAFHAALRTTARRPPERAASPTERAPSTC